MTISSLISKMEKALFSPPYISLIIVHVGAARASKGLFSTVENSPFGIRCAMRGRSQRSWTQSEKYIPLAEHSPLCRVLNVP